MQQHRPYWHMKMARYCNSFSGSIPPNFEHNYVAIEQTLGKIATTSLLDKRMKICHEQGFNDIGVVIATK